MSERRSASSSGARAASVAPVQRPLGTHYPNLAGALARPVAWRGRNGCALGAADPGAAPRGPWALLRGPAPPAGAGGGWGGGPGAVPRGPWTLLRCRAPPAGAGVGWR